MPLDNNLVDALPNGYRVNGVVHFCQNTKPTASAVGDTWYKPSEGSEWFWNGSYWLSKETVLVSSDYQENSISVAQNISGGSLSHRDLSPGTAAYWFVGVTINPYFQSATDAANFWSFDVRVMYGDTSHEGLVLVPTATRPAAQWLKIFTSINSPKSSLTKAAHLIYVSALKTGNPSSFFFMLTTSYKFIHI